jgi:hypothetical protein
MQQSLSVSRLIRVGVNLAPPAAQSQNLSSLLILGSSPVIDVVSRMRAYTSLAQVATDFGTSAPEYLAAVLWFEQSPQPTQLLIGRWAQTPTFGRLYGAPLSPVNSSMAAWNAIASGGFSISVDALAIQHLAGLNFSAAANLNAVAAIIGAALVGATITYNAVFNRFEVVSNTTGAASIISFATPPSAGTDIGGMLGLTQASSGSYQANGIVAESALAAVTLFDANFGQKWYAVTVLGAVNADHLAIAAYIEGSATYHYYGVTTQEGAALVPTALTDIAYQLSVLKYDRTGVQYSSLNPYAVVSLLARILTTDYTANKSVITLMYKQEPGIGGESLNETQAQSLEAKNCNVFVNYNNNVAIIQDGESSSGNFIDVIMGTAAFALAIQTGTFNALFLSPNKIAQTDEGMHIITTAIEDICLRFENNGLLAPGVWNSDGFGEVKTGQFLSKGYYVFTPPIGQQNPTDRSARLATPIQIAAKLAGAVHKANIAVTVNS